MPILLTLFLILACLPDSWPRPGPWIDSPWLSVGLSWLGVAVVVAWAWSIARWTHNAVLCHSIEENEAARRFLRRARWQHRATFVIYALSLYILGYGWALHTLWASTPGQPWHLVEVLLLAPLLLSLLLSWGCYHDADRALALAHGAPVEPLSLASRARYVIFHVRQRLALFLIPVLLLLLEKELRRFFPGLARDWRAQLVVVGGLAVAGVVVGLPWALRTLLGLTPLPEGALRDRLEQAGRRLGFRATDILLWNTGGQVANALVVGLIPGMRYVLLTDRLVEELTPEEVEAVFGHEVGHVKHRHLLLYLAFLGASSLAVILALAPYLANLEKTLSFHGRPDLAMIPVVAATGAYIFLVFGFLSRRCERQADVYGCRAVSCLETACEGHAEGQPRARGGLCPTGVLTFIRALEKVARVNGIHPDRPGFLQSWQHSTIARRVGFLKTLLSDPQAEQRFQRRVLMVKVGLFAALGLALLLHFV